MSRAIGVAVPWNLPCYIPANGFHPLYEALFEDDEGLAFHSFDEAKLAAQLASDLGLYRDFEARRARIAPTRRTLPSDLGRSFFDRVSASCLAAMEQVPGEVELHHTAPLGLGRRPFLLHCESFLPTFAPFFSHGRGCLPEAAAVQRYYGELFRADSCLGILSHFQATLDQISAFFADARIDAKLARTPIGLPDAKLERLLALPKPHPGRAPRFLFTNSAHQNPASFLKRGGVASLLFARELLRSMPEARFVFRCARPEGRECAGVALDHPALAWIDGYLSEEQQLRLFSEADFLLLPSLNVHSVTILQAMAAGAIPVVSDTHGPDHYVTDQRTGIVVAGVRDAVWRTDESYGVRVDDHQAAALLQPDLAGGMLRRVQALLAAPGAVQAMRDSARAEVRARFRGSAFRAHVADEIARRLSAYRACARRGAAAASPPVEASAFPRRGDWAPLFASPPSPIALFRRMGVSVVSCKGVYYRFSGVPDVAYTDLFPYALHEKGLLGGRRARVADDARDLRRLTLGERAAGAFAGLRRRLRTERPRCES